MTTSNIYEALSTEENSQVLQDQQSTGKTGPFIGKRHWLILTILLLSETTHSISVYMTICIVAMTDPNANSNKDVPTYDWKNTGVILSSFYWGNCLSQMLGGLIVTKYKAKRPLLFVVLLSSLVGFLIPSAAAHTGSKGVIICRVIQGFAMGTMLPFIFYLYGKWVPPSERSRLIGFSTSGSIIGVVVSMFLSGQLAASRYGWPMVIYFYSSLSLVWCLIFGYVASNSPAEHTTISKEEKDYIESSLLQGQYTKLQVPYKKIFTSLPVWAIIITKSGGVIGFYTILSDISIYLKDILHINIQSNGMLSALPYVITIFLIYFFGYLSDLLITKGISSRTLTRKIMLLTALVIPCISLILLANSNGEETVKIIILLALIVSVDTAGSIQSIHLNPIDLAPNYCGVVEGVISQISSLFIPIGPMLVQLIVSEKGTVNEWKIVFYTMSAVRVVTGLIYLIFGSAKTQIWNDETEIERSYKIEVTNVNFQLDFETMLNNTK